VIVIPIQLLLVLTIAGENNLFCVWELASGELLCSEKTLSPVTTGTLPHSAVWLSRAGLSNHVHQLCLLQWYSGLCCHQLVLLVARLTLLSRQLDLRSVTDLTLHLA